MEKLLYCLILVFTASIGYTQNEPTIFTGSTDFKPREEPADELIIDLSEEPSTYELSISPKEDLDITVINRLLNGKYTYDINIYIKNEELTPIPLEDISGISEFKFMDGLDVEAFATDCETIDSLANAFYELDKEKDLPNYIAEVRSYLSLVSNSPSMDCVDEYLNLTTAISQAEKVYKTRMSKIKKGQILVVEITRRGGEEKKEWKWVFRAPSRGKWQTTYGFNHLSYLISAKDEYYLDPIDTCFQIRGGKSNDWFEINPTVLFTWYPSQNELRNWSVGFSGGLGLDFEKPSVLLGTSFTYNQNITIALGLASHQQQQLRTRYEEGQLLKENLATEQLHEDVYRLNPFINVSFRFDGNPFKKKETDTSDSNDEASEVPQN